MKTLRRFFWFVPTVIWMIVIFRFSAQEAEVSAGLSLKVSQEVAYVLHETVMQEYSYDTVVEIVHPGVRKCAHMAEYAVLYCLLFLSFFFSTLATRSAAVSIVIAFGYACFDELHQTFVSGRSGNFMDVCVDMTGVLFAVALILFIYSFWQAHHLYKEEERKEKLEVETDERIRAARIEGAKLERERLRNELYLRKSRNEGAAPNGTAPNGAEPGGEEPEKAEPHGRGRTGRNRTGRGR